MELNEVYQVLHSTRFGFNVTMKCDVFWAIEIRVSALNKELDNFKWLFKRNLKRARSYVVEEDD
jgi:hypothetical protein